MSTLRGSLRELVRYPSALIGMAIVLLLLATAAYAVIKIPYATAIQLWRGGEDVWYKNPKYAPPTRRFGIVSKRRVW